MRLAQIARKVKTKPAEIRAFVKDKFNVELDKDPNIKLDDEHVDAVLEAFKIEEVIEEVKKEAPVVVEEEIEIDPNIDTDLESLKEAAEEVVAQADPIEIPEVKVEAEKAEPSKPAEEVIAEESSTEEKKAVAIKHQEETEETEVEENPEAFIPREVDENAELIKAEVDRLEGLKVVGKIELEDRETKKLMNEEVELPSADSVESEIDVLDGDVDTSEFTDLSTDVSEEDKEALFAELDAAMEANNSAKVKKVKKVVTEETEEDSIYKDKNGIYHFTSEQRANRKKSMAEKAIREKARIQKEKKARHYQEHVAPKVKAPTKKKKSNQKNTSSKDQEKAAQNEAKGLWGKFLNWINDRN
ncbi:MAG: hypothetical protein ABJG68_09715 [Crocinitomicaceae bacterium]